MIKKNIWILLLKLKGSYFEQQYNQIRKINSEEELLNAQVVHLRRLLLNAHQNVPFYAERLKNFIEDDDADLDEFHRIPLLTKGDIRKYKKELTSIDIDTRKWYYNSSGGSTGEPVRFIQDELFDKWNNATLRYYYENIVGIDELAMKKVLLWGSEREIFKGTVELKAKFRNWLKGTILLNSFRMNESDMKRFVNIINSYKPDLIRGYAGSLYRFCEFIERKGVSIHQPKLLIGSAEKLRKEMREKIESVFGTKVYNFYGSREVGAIAGECNAGLLHIFKFNNNVEVLDEHSCSVKEGETGKLIVTALHNYSMPLIRYEIGDMAISGPKRCKCGNPLPTLKEITGRIFDHFIREDGTIIYGGYFTVLFFLKDWIKDYRVIQEDYRKIRILATLRGDINYAEKREIESKIKLVMGKDCKVLWEFIEEMPRTRSGKYLYTKSLIHRTRC